VSRGGLVADVRGVASDAVRILRTRLELLTIEFQEEKARLIRLAFVASASLFFAFFGMLLALLWLVMALPEEYRLRALGLLGLAFLAAAGACGWWLSHSNGHAPFSASIRTLTRDEAALRGGDD
jgi:uncharacterized membrane protein YqjE